MREKLIVLIQAPYIEDYGPMKKAAGTYFPLGIGYISAYIKRSGYSVHFFDPNVQEVILSDMVDYIRNKKPLLVGISFMTPQFYTTKKIVDAIKNASPETSIVLGGAHPSVMPKQTLEEIPNADYVVYNEGEQTLLELLDFLGSQKGSFESIDGLVWRNGLDDIVQNKPRELIEDLDKLPYPDRDLIDQSIYRAQSFLSYYSNSINIYTSRGCPGRCSFCASGHKLRSRIRERSIENVIEEITFLRKRYEVDYLLIKDDTFTMRKSRVEKFCQMIKKHHPDLKWHCMVRVNTVNEELLATMKDAGLNDVFLGIESGNNEILKKAGKGITIEQTKKAVEACSRQGIRTYGAFIIGLPGDSRKSIRETIDFACSLPLTMAGFSILIPYPGTKIYEDFYEGAKGSEIDYRKFIASTGVDFVKDYTGLLDIKPEELPAFVSEAQRRFYFRPTQFFRLIGSANRAMLVGYFKGFMALVTRVIFLSRNLKKDEGS